MTESVLFEVRDGAAWLTLNEPRTRNSLNEGLCAALLGALERASAQPALRAVVLAARGPVFCAGADLKSGGGAAVSGAEGPAGLSPYARILRALWNFPRPVIGRIQGGAYGGGMGLLASCDIAVLSREARFAFSEVRLGLVPALVSVPVLRKVSRAVAARLFFTGELFSAGEACAMGLGYKAVPESDLDTEVETLLGTLSLCAPGALGRIRRLLCDVPEMSFDQALAGCQELSRELFESDEGREGLAAFAEKRKPSWAE